MRRYIPTGLIKFEKRAVRPGRRVQCLTAVHETDRGLSACKTGRSGRKVSGITRNIPPDTKPKLDDTDQVFPV